MHYGVAALAATSNAPIPHWSIGLSPGCFTFDPASHYCERKGSKDGSSAGAPAAHVAPGLAMPSTAQCRHLGARSLSAFQIKSKAKQNQTLKTLQ